jgi:hypothetical protein
VATLRAINLGVRFLLELASLAAFAYWGATLPRSFPTRVAIAVGLPLIVAIFWGVFVSPKARIPTGRFGRAGLGLVVFLASAGTLRDRGHPSLAATFAVIAVVSSVLVSFLPQSRGET